MLRRASRWKLFCCSCQALIAKYWCGGGRSPPPFFAADAQWRAHAVCPPADHHLSFLLPLLSQCGPRSLYESRVLPACGGKGERSIMSSCRNVIMSSLAKTEHSHPLGMVVSTHFRCGKGVKRGLKNGALPFNID